MIDVARPVPPKAQRVITWREHLSVMDDEKFFSIVHDYLGEVQTPFNKHNLIENLSAFLRKEENKRAIVTMLGERDIQIVSAVSMFENPSVEKIRRFLSSAFTDEEISVHLENLEERLVLYQHKNKNTGEQAVSLVPLMEDALKSVANVSVILKHGTTQKKKNPSGFFLSPLYIASYMSFLLNHSDAVKLDGTFKKRASEDLSEIFGKNTGFVKTLHASFLNLHFFYQDDKRLVPDWKKIESFSRLPPLSQYLYLCVSSGGNLILPQLKSYGEKLQRLLCSIPSEGYTMSSMIVADSLISEKAGEVRRGSRFAQILSSSLDDRTDNPPFNFKIEKILHTCIEFGLLYPCGSDDNGCDTYTCTEGFKNLYLSQEEKKSLSIDAGFSVTVLPGMSLEKLVPLIKFADVKKCDAVVAFEISRKSVMRGFNSSLSLASMTAVLTENSNYPISQSLKISLEEWYGSFTSVTLFSGFVLRVQEHSAHLVLQNPKLSPHVVQEIASGCFLMDFTDDYQAGELLSDSGIDFVGKVKAKKEITSSSGEFFKVMPSYMNLFADGKNEEAEKENSSSYKRDKKAQKELQDSLKEELKKISCTPEQHRVLLERIERRIIVNKEQLRANSVKFENIEAGAMDFTGKVHIVESAIQNGSLLEILVKENSSPITGVPVSLDKKNDMTVVLSWKENGETKLASVPLRIALYVKKILRPIRFD